MQRPTIIHVITGLKRSGAENVLLRLAKNLDSFTHIVVSLTAQTADDLTSEFRQAGIETFHLNMQPTRFITFLKCIRLLSIIKQHKPDIMQTWMYHADVIGGLIGRIARIKTIIWNIRNGSLPKEKHNPFIVRIASWLSNLVPTAIISCSQDAIDFHSCLGYRCAKFAYIPNGIDCEMFHIDRDAGKRFKEFNCMPSTTRCVGLVARWHEQKDIPTFLKACSLVAHENNNVRFVMIGNNLDPQNQALAKEIQSFAGLSKKMLLLGGQRDIPALMNGLDVLCMTSSFGEGFPNVLGEAMACGINCVATDVGDAAEIVNNMGYVAPIGDAKEIAKGILELLKNPKNDDQLRQHILRNYSLQKMTADYGAFYNQFGCSE